MKMHRRLVLGGLGAMIAAGRAAAQTGLAGAYAVEGRNPDGTVYTGDAQIAAQNGVYTIVWVVAGRSFSGAGRLEGRVLTVNWGDSAPVVYVVMPDGSLHGTWANGRALDRLTRR